MLLVVLPSPLLVGAAILLLVTVLVFIVVVVSSLSSLSLSSFTSLSSWRLYYFTGLGCSPSPPSTVGGWVLGAFVEGN